MDAISLFEKTRERLRKHEGQYAELARQSGLSYSQLTKLAQGHAPNPTVETLQKVIDALDAFEGVEKAEADQVGAA
ncbi:MAG TPA: helix-turn-helix transcriptional regulator [Pseudoxanthomonas sp.]